MPNISTEVIKPQILVAT